MAPCQGVFKPKQGVQFLFKELLGAVLTCFTHIFISASKTNGKKKLQQSFFISGSAGITVDKSHLVACLSSADASLELIKLVGDVEPAKKFLNIQRVIISEGCDMNGFSQLAACFSERSVRRR